MSNNITDSIQNLSIEERMAICDKAEEMLKSADMPEELKQQFLVFNKRLRLMYQKQKLNEE